MQMAPSTPRIYDHQPNQHAFTVDKPFVTNSLGFRDDREIPAIKGDEVRILSIGDSVAVGLGVRAEDTYASRLERRLRQRELRLRVIIGAASGYGTWEEIDLLKERGVTVQPDIVLLEFFWNDLYVKPANVEPCARVFSTEPPLWYYVRWMKRSRVLSFLRERLELLWFRVSPSFDFAHQETIYAGRTSPYLEQAYAEVAANLEEFQALADAHGFRPILVLFPMPSQVRRGPDAPSHLQRRMQSIAARIGLPVVDLLTPMQRANAETHDLYLPWDNTHLSPTGHALVADVLDDYLEAHRAAVR